jgi:hypothetical protein
MAKTITIKIQRAPAVIKNDIFRVRKWGDPIMVALQGADVNQVGTTNFQVIKTASFGNLNEPYFNCIFRWQRFSEGGIEMTYLRSLQHDKDGFTINQKMNWLIGDATDGVPERPYWFNGDGWVYFGPLLFGGQLVKVDPTPIWRVGEFPKTGVRENIKFYHVIGVRKSEFGKYSHKTHPWFIQHATGAGRNNQYDEYPKGEIFHPVWSDIDYPTNFGDGRIYIAEKFLEI